MAALTSQQRGEAAAQFGRDLSASLDPCGVTKPNLRAAIDAADQWCEDNAASFNSAIPQPARGALTSAQKARLLAVVALKRFGVGG